MPPFTALLVTKTSGYRHASIPALTASLHSLFTSALPASSRLLTTESSSDLPSLLPTVDILILASTTGPFLPSPPERAALQAFIARRGGAALIGIHACTAGETAWPWYGDLLGAVFDGHPVPQWGLVRVKPHFITRALPTPDKHRLPADAGACPEGLIVRDSAGGGETVPWFDEWYNFKKTPTDELLGAAASMSSRQDLMTVDESTYEGGTLGSYHPVAWTHEFGEAKSRVFYTALGHFDEAFADPWFMGMLERALYWVTRQEDAFKSTPS